ncbi:hypothetical protein [Novosphingobium clariflavum]|uniref:Uncharacterized protein n=1 Tax=Novosphingobium clariflavum TaxID=2029884 RepID=A0ABV6S2F1_9SPHN|nr:hypothetical protein [Novosphingobium clariflavum]
MNNVYEADYIEKPIGAALEGEASPQTQINGFTQWWASQFEPFGIKIARIDVVNAGPWKRGFHRIYGRIYFATETDLTAARLLL